MFFGVSCSSVCKGRSAVGQIFFSTIAKGVYNIFCVFCRYCFFLVRGRQSAFSPNRGYSLHCDTIVVQNLSSSNEQLSRPERDRHWRTINQTQKIIYDRTLDRMLSLSLSLSLSLHFNGHFPGGPWLASTGTSPFRILLELTMTGGDWQLEL